jgi:hypothetical protein
VTKAQNYDYIQHYGWVRYHIQKTSPTRTLNKSGTPEVDSALLNKGHGYFALRKSDGAKPAFSIVSQFFTAYLPYWLRWSPAQFRHDPKEATMAVSGHHESRREPCRFSLRVVKCAQRWSVRYVYYLETGFCGQKGGLKNVIRYLGRTFNVIPDETINYPKSPLAISLGPYFPTPTSNQSLGFNKYTQQASSVARTPFSLYKTHFHPPLFLLITSSSSYPCLLSLGTTLAGTSKGPFR